MPTHRRLIHCKDFFLLEGSLENVVFFPLGKREQSHGGRHIVRDVNAECTQKQDTETLLGAIECSHGCLSASAQTSTPCSTVKDRNCYPCERPSLNRCNFMQL